MGERMTSLDRLGKKVAEEEDAILERQDRLPAIRQRLFSSGQVPRAPRRESRRWILGGAFALAASLVLVFALQGSRPLTFVVGTADARGALGAWIAAPEVGELPVRFSDGTLLLLDRGSRARVTSTDTSGANITVERGHARADFVPRQHGQWRVDVGPFQVLVTGTRFDVEWDPGQEHFALALHEGLVTVSGPVIGEGRKVHAGETIQAFCKEKRVEISDDAAPATTPPGAERAVAPGAGPVAPVPPLETGPDPVAAGEGPPSPANAHEGWRELAAAGKYRKALEAAERGGFEKECERASAEDLVALGDAARFAGQPARAVQALQALRKRFPADPRAGAAAFELGRVAFDQQGSFGEAAKWFAIYLRERPHGSLAREASGRLMESLSKAGDNTGARDAATKYLARYPSGPHSELARNLVGP
jgi:transmembrane sensor